MEQTGLTISFDLAEMLLDDICDDDLLDWMGQNLELALAGVNDVAKALARIHNSVALTECFRHVIDCENEISSNLDEIAKLVQQTEHRLIPTEDDEPELL